MQRLLSFVLAHWVLVSMFLISLFAYLRLEMGASGMGMAVQAQELINLMNNHGAAVIDIRDKSAFSKGHLINSKNIPADQLVAKMTSGNRNKETPIILVCSAGKNSAPLAVNLKKAGFQRVSLLSGGIDEWKRQELPVITSGN